MLARGGAGRSNVFTKIMLALFGFIPWRAVPVMPVEIMLLPKWFPFHLDKISYWSRTVIVPLLVLMAKKPRARNPKNIRIDELFLEPPHTMGPAPKAPQQKAMWFWFFRVVDNVLRATEPMFPKGPRQRAIGLRDGMGRRAAQRRGRAWRDFSGDGEQRDDVRRAGLSAGSSATRDRAASRSKSCWWCNRTRPIASPACRRSGTPGLPPTRCWRPATPRRSERVAKGLALARAEADSGRAGRLDRAAARCAAGRLGVPICQSALSRCRRHRGGGDGDGSRAGTRCQDRSSRGDRAGAGVDHRLAERATAPGARSTPTTNTTISTTFRSPITARCSIRRPRTSPRAACRCWRSSARRRRTRQRWRRRSTISGARSLPTEAGTAAGA